MIQFLYIALGSAAELETQLIIAKKLGYKLKDNVYDKIIDIKKVILGLIKHLKGKKGK